MKRYYYSRSGSDVQGPISEDDLWQMVRAGILPASIQVCCEGSEQWSGISLTTLPPPPPGPPLSVVVMPTISPPETEQDDAEESTEEQKDDRVLEIIGAYGWGAMGAMVAIPLPGADIGATFAVWGKMIYDIAHVYGYDISMEDAKRLGSDLFKSVILTTAAWFASAKTASTLCKFIPFAGTATAFVIDSVIAGLGAKSITARLGTAAALYYKSDRAIAPETMAAHVKNVVADPQTIRNALSIMTLGVSADALSDVADMADDAPSRDSH